MQPITISRNVTIIPAALTHIYVTTGIIQKNGVLRNVVPSCYSTANFNINLTFAAIKYSFTQADEILPKINAFKQ